MNKLLKPLRPILADRKLARVYRAALCSGPYEKARLDASIEYLAEKGFKMAGSKAELYKGAREKTGEDYDYLAVSDKLRAASVAKALFGGGASVAWCARGGVGAGAMLRTLDQSLNNNRKAAALFVGFSDATAVHAWLLSRKAAPSLHAPNLNRFTDADEDVKKELFCYMQGSKVGEPLNIGSSLRTVRKGKARGVIAGGNLAVLSSLVGTPFMPSLNGAILLLEDVDEYPYRTYRMLAQLRDGGALEGVAGAILGEFSAPKDVNQDELSEHIERLAADFLPKGAPILSGLSVGHGKINFPVPLGVGAELDAANKTLAALSPWIEFKN